MRFESICTANGTTTHSSSFAEEHALFFFALPPCLSLSVFMLSFTVLTLHPRTLQLSIFSSTHRSFFWTGKPSKKSQNTLLLTAFFKQRLLSAPSNRRAIFSLIIKAPFKRVPNLTGSIPHGHSCKKRLWEQI